MLRPGRSELGVALLLGVVGVVVLADALSLDAPTTDSDRVGPQAFPIAVACCCSSAPPA